jgi:hypothetical protein
MSNANDNTYPRSKRLRSNSYDSPDDNWLTVVLNEDEVDPTIDTWNYFFKDSNVSQHTPQNSENTFNTPFIFKSVNPAQNLVNGIEYSEDLVGKVVEVLGIVLEEVKNDIWRTILNVNQGKNKKKIISIYLKVARI